MGRLRELLATPDAIRITTPRLSRETMQKVLDLIRADAAEDKIKVDNPTQNLESYFLGVVERAKRSALETSGASSGSRVAAYLRGEADAQPATNKILERLTLPAAGQKGQAEPVEPRVTETVDEAKLRASTRPAQPTPAGPRPAAPEAAAPPDPSQA